MQNTTEERNRNTAITKKKNITGCGRWPTLPDPAEFSYY